LPVPGRAVAFNSFTIAIVASFPERIPAAAAIRLRIEK
jgi:hypothetical protein